MFESPFVPLSDAERDVSLNEIIASLPPGDPWIFTCGSLMWDRGLFDFSAASPALLHGYHRSFCVWTQLARGTPERPGLALGLVAGGACRGIAYRIKRRLAADMFDRVWRREMFTGCYAPRW
ncbi:MAG: gamma-glutamylcyclotransferase, partial [Proteobacteria bacterium]|nr:gamma-glutamylcyclotransferase [Pseudomonadota bacterium]